MSVEKVGAQGFDYQYIITLYMVLNYLEKDHLKVWVENKSFEDAQFSYQIEDKIYQIELQVKKRTSDISIDEFAGWLAHFQKNKSDCFILDKIQECDTNYFVIVTNSRCTDRVSKFVGNGDELKENRIRFSENELEDLKKRIIDKIASQNDLDRKRKEHIEQYFNQKKGELKKVLSRICVVERKDQVETEICTLLRNKYQIPETECTDVMNQMLAVIRQGRDDGEDIVSSITKIIEYKRFSRILPEDDRFYKRDCIDILKHELLQKNVLLLTGVPFSGKTYIAKTIAQEFQEKGYNVKRTDNILDDQEAYYFFMSPKNDLRLLLLEDPFGHIRQKENVIEVLDKVKNLIQDKLSSNRKLIITSRMDIVLEIFHKKQIEDCKIHGNSWNNTSITDMKEAKKIWMLFYGKSDESLQVFEKLNAYFSKQIKEIFLEIGEIRHLLLEVNDIHTLMKMSTDEIIEQARISSKEVCHKIKAFGEKYKEIFILMGCFCNTVRSVNMKDLAYILCSKEGPVSIRKNMKEEVTISVGGTHKSSQTKQVFPVYTQKAELDSEIKGILRSFCEKGYIYKERFTNELYFLHPIYAYASELLLKEEIEEAWDIEKYITNIRRAISYLSPHAAICSLFSLKQNFDSEQMIIDCIMEGSRSIFPAVRDVSVLYLDQNFDNLNEEMQEDFMNNIRNSRTADKYIQWNHDECWYQMDGHHSLNFFDTKHFGRTDVNITLEEIEHRLNNERNFSKKELYDIMCSKLADDLSQAFLEYVLLSDEAIIRSKAIFYLFKNYGAKIDFEKTSYLHHFENYNVVYNMLKGMFKSIEIFDDKNIRLLITYFQKQFDRKSVSMYVEDLFDKFGDQYDSKAVEWGKYSETEKLKIWKIWAALFSRWLVCFPAKFMWMHEPHMCNNAEQSLKYLKNQKEVIVVANAWIQWIKNYSRHHSVNDYGMSVLNYLITGTENSSHLRKSIIQRELQSKNTSLVTAHMSNIVDLWNILTTEEKDDICRYLKSEIRCDIKWIQAITVTRKNVPKEIQTALTGSIFLDKETEEIIRILEDKKILTECLHIFCGFPQPLWFNGYHHSGEYSLWDGLMMEILRKHVIDECYYISLREFINSLYNDETYRFSNGYNLYKEMLSDEENRKQIFARLAYVSATQNQDNKRMWDDLLQNCSEKEKQQYFAIIGDFIEMIEWKNIGYNGLLCEYNLEDIVQYILPCFSSDKCIYNISNVARVMHENIQKMKNNPYIETDNLETYKLNYEKILEKIYKNDPPRLLFTNRLVDATCKIIELESEAIQEALTKSKNDFQHRYQGVKETFKEDCPLKIQDEYALKNWYD